MNEETCIICKSDFRALALKNGKCSVCNKKYPTAMSPEDIKKKDPKSPRTMSESVVREMIYEILEDAGMKRVKCEKCNQLFFRLSPAQKQCSSCKDKEVK